MSRDEGLMRPQDALSSALELASELDPSGRTVASYTLRSHQSHIRVLYPAYDADGNRVSWVECGRAFEARSDITWREVAGPRRRDTCEPEMGSVDPMVLDVLLRQLLDYGDAAVVVAQWEGYADAEYPTEAHRATLPPERPSAVWSLPPVSLRGLSRGPMRWWDPQLRWVVGNDIYARSIFVSGPEALIEALLHEPALEAFRVSPSDAVAVEDR